MIHRRNFVASLAAAPFFAVPPAGAFEFAPYESAAAHKLIASGKPVIIHVYAPWCLQCHLQASILDKAKGDKTYDGVSFFKVDYDNQKDVVAQLNCPRSTLIAYRGGKEAGRMSWGITEDAVLAVLRQAV